MSSPVDVQLGYPWTSKKWTSLVSVKNLGKIKNLTSPGIEPGIPECRASVVHPCYSCSYNFETKGIFQLPY
jgi:hypothetical protein